MKTRVVTVTEENMSEYIPTCFLNPKNEGYQMKREWLHARFLEGLKIKLLYPEESKKCIGFIEYTPGEFAWRAVDAAGYLFIHCIWISPNKYKEKGHGSRLVEECIQDARQEGKYGVAVVTSEGSFMAGRALFSKNGFESVAEARPSYSLMVRSFRKGPIPKFRSWEEQLAKCKGLHMVYTNQCPWVARSARELVETAREKGLKLKVTELKTAKEAQNAPSPYAVFNLLHDGVLLADHYISNRRFLNIIEKEFGR